MENKQDERKLYPVFILKFLRALHGIFPRLTLIVCVVQQVKDETSRDEYSPISAGKSGCRYRQQTHSILARFYWLNKCNLANTFQMQ